jgi:hypothetical protein
VVGAFSCPVSVRNRGSEKAEGRALASCSLALALALLALLKVHDKPLASGGHGGDDQRS